MTALRSRCGHYIFVLWFLVLSSSFFSSSNLSSRRLDVYHTSTHDVVLVRIQNAYLKCTACGSLKIQDAKIAKKSPFGRHRSTLSRYIFATKACIDDRKKMLNSDIFSIYFHNMVDLRPTNG